MEINSIGLHSQYPEKVWIIVEQPQNEPFRIKYDPVSQTFSRTSIRSLIFERGVKLGFSSHSVYGWIGGTGIPPAPHHDVILLTTQSPAIGDILLGTICGVFLRHDQDHKFVAIDDEISRSMAKMDIECLDAIYYQELLRMYPRIGEGEGWFGADVAFTYLRKKPLAR
jgi:hypothetical protein